MSSAQSEPAVNEILDRASALVDKAIYKGDFWLSVDKPTNYWIFLDDLNTSAFVDPLTAVFETVFKQFLAANPGEWNVLYCRQFLSHVTELGDLIMPLALGIEALQKAGYEDRLRLIPIGISERRTLTQISDEQRAQLASGSCLIVIALSVHVNLIEHMAADVARLGGKVTHVLTVVEREEKGRPILQRMGLSLIPMMVWQQTEDALAVSSVLRSFDAVYEPYHRYFQEDFVDLDEILKLSPPKETSKLRNKLRDLQSQLPPPLYAKAEKIIRGVDALYERNQGITHADTETIQRWLLKSLSADDFKAMARVAFAAWATPERLTGEGVQHINLANDIMGREIAETSQRLKLQMLRILDLGAGALGTVGRVVRKLAETNTPVSIDAVEFTHELLAAAYARRLELEKSYPNCSIVVHDQEMLTYVRALPNDSYHFITISYAIHHLHPDEQGALVQEMHRCLRPGGVCFIADPQEGKSDFNRNVLLREEPEGVFAIFSSPEKMIMSMEKAGFTRTQILEKDQEYKGFLVCGTKQTQDPA